jgi:hypothetical protein
MPIFQASDLNSLILALFQCFFILGGFFYVIFAIVVIRQIVIMERTLLTSFNPIILILGYIHLGLAMSVLLFYIAIL